jgi:two-component system NarL family response regulator
MTIRTVLVDDHHLLREALREKLEKEADIEIVGEAGCGSDALKVVDELAPDVVVLDIALPDTSGVEIARSIVETHRYVKVVALSMYSDKRFVIEMLKSGASGYVTKTAGMSELLSAIRAVALGRRYLCPEVAEALIDNIQVKSDDAPRLGKRERAVLRLLADGMRSADIAAQLHISTSTVEVHRRNIMRKLGLHTVAELTKYAIREGLTGL